MNDAEIVCFSLGSNLGDRLEHIKTALMKLRKCFGEEKIISSVYETEPWGVKNHPDYLNAVVCFFIQNEPHAVLKIIAEIENSGGRKRQDNDILPRTIDIDILFYGKKIINEPQLIVPHPKIEFRKFILLPLSEIMYDFIHPVIGQSIAHLLEGCNDFSEVRKTNYQPGKNEL